MSISRSEAAPRTRRTRESLPTNCRGRPAPLTRDWFAELGAYGFRDSQVVILAALVTADPLLLIGRSGTGKTFLLNSISEAMGLEHRHYNASLIAFDDLVGFPYPDDARESVRFLQTPATVWGAESVLIDEISRCKPEHQNRLFSLVHERRVQGIALERLRYRWAAMNPCTTDQDGGEYLGSEPLDPALADRFAVLVDVGDWGDLGEAEQRKVGDPSGEALALGAHEEFRARIAHWLKAFEAALARCPDGILDYACAAANALNGAGIRISPRRVRLLTRTLLAAATIEGAPVERSFQTVLACSVPHRAWGEVPAAEKIHAAHRLAWDATLADGEQRWVHGFHVERLLAGKVRRLLETCPGPDAGTLAVEQLIANESPERALAFALAVYPAAVAGDLPVGAEAINNLGKLAMGALEVRGEIHWQERLAASNTTHPELARLGAILERLPEGARRDRARQLFYWAIVNGHALAEPEQLEADFHRAVACVAGRVDR